MDFDGLIMEHFLLNFSYPDISLDKQRPNYYCYEKIIAHGKSIMVALDLVLLRNKKRRSQLSRQGEFRATRTRNIYWISRAGSKSSRKQISNMSVKSKYLVRLSRLILLRKRWPLNALLCSRVPFWWRHAGLWLVKK